MIELAMIFALGFFAASLLSLVLLPVVSHRAIRLATQRLRMLVPLSPDEIRAQRDHLRAEHAIAVRGFERRMDELREKNAALMIDNGRQSARLIKLDQALVAAQAEIVELEATIARITFDVFEAQGTLGTQTVLLHDTLGLADRRLAKLNDAAAQVAASEAVIDEQRATIAGLETRGTGQDLRLRNALAQTLQLTERLQATNEALERVTGERDIARADAALVTARRDALQARVENLTGRLADAENGLQRERDAAAEKSRRLGQQADAIDGLNNVIAQHERDLAATRLRLGEAEARRDLLQIERDHLAELQSQIDDVVSRSIQEFDGADEPAGEPRRTRETELPVLRAMISSLAADLVRFAEQERLGEPDQPARTGAANPAPPLPLGSPKSERDEGRPATRL